MHTRSGKRQKLFIIPTTRSQAKADSTVVRLQSHLRKVCETHECETKNPGIAPLLEAKVTFEPLLLDLNSILGVRKAAKELEENLAERGGKLDVLIANAGIGGWTGVDWLGVVKQFVTEGPLATLSRPKFKMSSVGTVTARQIPQCQDGHMESKLLANSIANGKTVKEEESPLGEVFCANVFGHYLLGHWLSPALTRAASVNGERGRMIWVSTLEAYAHALNFNDLQGLATPISYESSKRLTDLLALTSDLPSTQPYVESYFSTAPSSATPNTHDPSTRPKIYVSHPGICVTTIMPLHPIIVALQAILFYIARFFGSYWHTSTAWSGATAPVWLSLASSSMLDEIEENEGKGKWGSMVNAWGEERAVRTEVAGWGFGGRIGEIRPKVGRWDLWVNDEESLKEFELLGRESWARLEGLRTEWEGRIKRADVEEMD